MIRHCKHCQKLTNNKDGYCSDYCRQFEPPKEENYLYNCIVLLEEQFTPEEICNKIGMPLETYNKLMVQ